jgi:hypothetical protein
MLDRLDHRLHRHRARLPQRSPAQRRQCRRSAPHSYAIMMLTCPRSRTIPGAVSAPSPIPDGNGWSIHGPLPVQVNAARLARRESIQPIARTELCLEVRAAVHAGEIELEGGNVRGAAMHIAARDALALAKLRASGNFPARKPATRPHFCERYLAVFGVRVVVVPPLVRRRLRVALGRVLPLLLPSKRGDVEIAPGCA